MKVAGKSKGYASLVEMFRDLGEPEFADDLERHIAARSVGHALSHLRASAGLSEAELATRLGWKASRVERFEVTPDADIKLGDVIAYARAIGFALTLEFEHDAGGTRPGFGVRTIA